MLTSTIRTLLAVWFLTLSVQVLKAATVPVENTPADACDEEDGPISVPPPNPDLRQLFTVEEDDTIELTGPYGEKELAAARKILANEKRERMEEKARIESWLEEREEHQRRQLNEKPQVDTDAEKHEDIDKSEETNVSETTGQCPTLKNGEPPAGTGILFEEAEWLDLENCNPSYDSDVCAAKCNKGYASVGQDADYTEEYTCENETWVGENLQCSKITCVVPENPPYSHNAVWKDNSCKSGATKEYGDKCIADCDPHYIRTGNFEYRCVESREFDIVDEPPPKCRKGCGKNGTLSGNDEIKYEFIPSACYSGDVCESKLSCKDPEKRVYKTADDNTNQADTVTLELRDIEKGFDGKEGAGWSVICTDDGVVKTFKRAKGAPGFYECLSKEEFEQREKAQETKKNDQQNDQKTDNKQP